jgi:hypothetical protein
MGKINLDHWFVKDNNISISLMNFFVSINFSSEDNELAAQLTVNNSEMEKLSFTFYSLENAIEFTENVISKCNSLEDISKAFNEKNEHGEIKRKVSVVKTNEAYLTKENIYNAIVGCFGRNKNYKVSATSEIYDGIDGKSIYFYLIEHFECDGIKKENRVYLTDGDIRKAISYYLSETEFEFVDFLHGNSQKITYREIDEEHIYEGIDILIAKKEKEKKEDPKKKLKKVLNK